MTTATRPKTKKIGGMTVPAKDEQTVLLTGAQARHLANEGLINPKLKLNFAPAQGRLIELAETHTELRLEAEEIDLDEWAITAVRGSVSIRGYFEDVRGLDRTADEASVVLSEEGKSVQVELWWD